MNNGYGLSDEIFSRNIDILYGYEEFINGDYTYKSEYDMYNNGFVDKTILKAYSLYKKRHDLYYKSWRPTFEIMITDVCNLYCKHCHKQNTNRTNIMWDLNHTKRVVFKVLKLLKLFNIDSIGNIIISGGEPFCNKNLNNILQYICSIPYTKHITILTNGTIKPSDEIMKTIIDNNIIVQISIDGMKDTHNYIRGNEIFDVVEQNIDYYINNNVDVNIHFVACNINYKEYKDVVEYFSRKNIKFIFSDRYVEQNNSFLKALNKSENKEYFQIVKSCENNISKPYKMFQGDYICYAGYNMKICFDDNIIPCGKINLSMGNILSDDILHLYSKIKKERMKLLFPPKECFTCNNVLYCNGGSRCIAIAESKSTNTKDPACNCF